MNQKTPLYQEHTSLGAKICAFAGYDMPIQYALGVTKEHEWVRTQAGLFDVSHMGQAIVTGAKAAEFFSHITPSSFLKTPHSMAKYTVLTNDQGGIIDDLIITRMNDDTFFVVFNAGRKAVDIAWMQQNLPNGVSFESMPDHALLALQGPKAESVLTALLPDVAVAELGYMRMMEASWNGAAIFVSRLGYTGEDGFEISIAADQAAALWNALLADDAVEAIGLAARDSLRLEMGYPLYGHDLNEETTPIEADIAWIIGKEHESFIGADVIVSQRQSGPDKKRVGVKLVEKGIAREGAVIYSGEQPIGTLTSGGFSPSLKIGIGQGYVDNQFANEGQAVQVEVRGRRIAAEIHNLAFMPPQTKRKKKVA